MSESFLNDRVELHCGDCRDVLATLPENSIDACVTDPPYLLTSITKRFGADGAAPAQFGSDGRYARLSGGFMGSKWDAPPPPAIDPGFAYWMAGFIDGEGCFSVHKKTVNGCETYDCQFSMTLRADDKPIIVEMQRQLGGIGSIADRPAPKDGQNSKPQVRYCISSQRDCQRLREILTVFPLRAKKARDFEIWSHALDAWLAHEPATSWQEVAYFRKALMDVRQYGAGFHPAQLWAYRWAREVYRVLKPGAHLVAMGGTRTFHRLTAAIEDAGFEIRDTISFLYGSGFPKSHDVSKGIDRAAGAKRDVVGIHPFANRGTAQSNQAVNLSGSLEREQFLYAAATAAAREWAGWGTALKPACELIVLARKPLSESTVAANVLRWSVGALNIDGCRVAVTGQRPYDDAWDSDQPLCASCAERAESTEKPTTLATKASSATKPVVQTSNAKDENSPVAIDKTVIGCCDGMLADITSINSNTVESGKIASDQSQKVLNFTTSTAIEATTDSPICVVCGATITHSNTPPIKPKQNGSQPTPQGRASIARPNARWPANLLHDGSDEVVAAFPESDHARGNTSPTKRGDSDLGWMNGGISPIDSGDSGSAARFFFQAKPDTPGRWPANVVHDGSPEVVAAFPESDGAQGIVAGSEPSETGQNGIYGRYARVASMAPRGDSGSAARFFYTARPNEIEQVVITWISDSEPQQATLLVDTGQLLGRATVVSASMGGNGWSTFLSGSTLTDLFRAASTCTIRTAIGSTTESRIWSYLISLLTSAFTADVNYEMASGGSHVANAAIGTRYLIITLGEMASLPGASRVMSGTRLKISVSAATEEQFHSAKRFWYGSKADADDRLGARHPTIKPLDLMQWLCRLVCPPGGKILDCFAGTGTTGEAAWREGMSAVLIEAEPEYQADIRRRMALALAGPDERQRESIKAKNLPRDDGPLFGGTDLQGGHVRKIYGEFDHDKTGKRYENPRDDGPLFAGRETWAEMWQRPFDFSQEPRE